MLLICSGRRISEPGGMTTQREADQGSPCAQRCKISYLSDTERCVEAHDTTVRGTLPGSNSITGREYLGNKINQGKLSRWVITTESIQRGVYLLRS